MLTFRTYHNDNLLTLRARSGHVHGHAHCTCLIAVLSQYRVEAVATLKHWNNRRPSILFQLFYRSVLSCSNHCLGIASRSQRVSLIVIPFCLSVCLDVCRSFCDLQPTTIDRFTTKFGRQVYTCARTCVSLFGSPTSHTFGARGKHMQNFAYFQHVDSEMAAL